MTYLGIFKAESREYQTLVLAQSDDEARRKLRSRLRAWCGADAREEDLTIRAFGDGRFL